MNKYSTVERDNSLDIMKTLLVIGMVLAHSFQLLQVGDCHPAVVTYFSSYINIITFSSFVYVFGATTWLAYLRKEHTPDICRRIKKAMIKLLIGFYISGMAYSLFVADNFSIITIIKILILWYIPGYSEFLLSFLAYLSVIYMIRKSNIIGGGNAPVLLSY